MSEVFDTYARYYDLLYCDKDYSAEAEYVASHIREHTPKAKRILELGCGTGAHAEHLARMGYTVHGVDMSETMLARANNRKAVLPPDVAARLTFDYGDVRTVRTGDIYDAVISLFHVASYQTGNADIMSMFDSASAHLREGGVFLFDCWYGPAVLTERPAVRVRRLTNDAIEMLRIAEPEMHPNENVVDVNYTVFITDRKCGEMKTITETHRMRYLFLPEVELMLDRSGFDLSDSLPWMGGELGFGSWAAVFVAKKLRVQ